MKGLLLAVGLIAALFISNSHASIYDAASYQSPKTQSSTTYTCYIFTNASFAGLSLEDCYTLIVNEAKKHVVYDKPAAPFEFSSISNIRWNPSNIQQLIADQTKGTCFINSSGVKQCFPNTSQVVLGRATVPVNSNTSSCPPDAYPLYTFERDVNNDGKADQCYDPRELDNASKCSDLFNSGSILTAGGNTSALVCKTFEDGSRCAFSRVEQGSTPYYQPNLEKGCFGDAEEIPDYDKDAPPAPQPEQCVPYFGGFACAADPKNYCSSNGSCIDGCGYVNDQFMCFRDEQCKGASCEPAPVNCETVPDAPICKDKETTPQPSFCEKNPTLESCQGGSNFCKKNPLAPSCQLGGDGGGTGGGGSDFVLDYDKLINGMKDAVKLIIDTNETPEFSEFKSEIDDKTSELDSEIDNFMNGSHFDGINDQISSNPFTGQFQLPSGGGCTAFDLGGHSLDLCGAAQKISSVLYYVFSFLTLLYLKNLFFSTVTPRKE